MIIDNIDYHQNIFFEMKRFHELPVPVYLKLDGSNFAGSIKLKPAVFIIDELEREGKIMPGVHSIIESSSGNLAIALAMICHSKGYPFTAVIDPNTTKDVLKILKVYNANIIVVTERDKNGGYLETRINRIKDIVATEDNVVWVNQYANRANMMCHYNTTAKEIHNVFSGKDGQPAPTHVFVGTSTTGTLNGVLKYFSEFLPATKIIAVEPEGSITFSNKLKPRVIPGIGASRPPELSADIDRSKLHDIVWIKEPDTVAMCSRLLNDYSLLFGGSTGSVVAAVLSYWNKFKEGDVVVAISPDFGHKYLETIYNPDWVNEKILANAITQAV